MHFWALLEGVRLEHAFERGQAVQIRVSKGARQEERQESKDAGDGMSKVGKHISKEGDRGKQTRNNAIKR